MRVAALDPVVDERPELVDVILDPERTPVDTRLVELPLTGTVTLSVRHVGAEPGGTLAILEELVRAHEAFMGAAFPTSHIAVVVADVGRLGGGGPRGVITVAPGHGEDRRLLAHELAHVYWPFHPPWIAEGAAEIMASRVAELRPLPGCSLADTLGALDRLAAESDGAGGDVYRGSGCAYSLGCGLFLDLYEALGDEAFRRGLPAALCRDAGRGPRGRVRGRGARRVLCAARLRSSQQARRKRERRRLPAVAVSRSLASRAVPAVDHCRHTPVQVRRRAAGDPALVVHGVRADVPRCPISRGLWNIAATLAMRRMPQIAGFLPHSLGTRPGLRIPSRHVL